MNNLEPFLPLASELEEMSNEEFGQWVSKASEEIPRREEKRDPLTGLRKRISKILKDDELSEQRKEIFILNEIKRYHRMTSPVPQPELYNDNVVANKKTGRKKYHHI